MKVRIERIARDANSSIGLLFIDDSFECFTLEDEFRNKKVWGETRIPAGTYVLGIQREITPLTKRYRNRFSWFEHHLHIKDVPGFTGIYIHVGNRDEDTAGCPLVGETVAGNCRTEEGLIGNSVSAFSRIYPKLYPAAKAGTCVIEIVDRDHC